MRTLIIHLARNAGENANSPQGIYLNERGRAEQSEAKADRQREIERESDRERRKD